MIIAMTEPCHGDGRAKQKWIPACAGRTLIAAIVSFGSLKDSPPEADKGRNDDPIYFS
jgi:hypothetical protein